MLALPCRTVDHWNVVRLGIAAHAPAEPASQPHQMGIIEGLVRSGERPPPNAKSARDYAPCRNKHSEQCDPRNHSCRSEALDRECSAHPPSRDPQKWLQIQDATGHEENRQPRPSVGCRITPSGKQAMPVVQRRCFDPAQLPHRGHFCAAPSAEKRRFLPARSAGRCQRLTLTEGSWAAVSVGPPTPPSRFTAPPPRASRREEIDFDCRVARWVSGPGGRSFSIAPAGPAQRPLVGANSTRVRIGARARRRPASLGINCCGAPCRGRRSGTPREHARRDRARPGWDRAAHRG